MKVRIVRQSYIDIERECHDDAWVAKVKEIARDPNTVWEHDNEYFNFIDESGFQRPLLTGEEENEP